VVRPVSLQRPALSAILAFELAPDQVEAASEVIRTTIGGAAMPVVHLKVPLDVEIGTGAG
jgi:DNA polymerase I